MFSRKAAFEPRLLCPNDVIAQCEKLLRRLVSEDLQLICEFGPEVAYRRSDALRTGLTQPGGERPRCAAAGGVIRITTAFLTTRCSGDVRLPPSGTAGNYVCIAWPTREAA